MTFSRSGLKAQSPDQRNYSKLLWTDNGFADLISSSDGNFVHFGYCNVSGNNEDFLLLKTDPVGDTLWSKIWGKSGNESGWAILELPNSDLIITGTLNFDPYNPIAQPSLIARLNPAGDTIWTRQLLAGNATLPNRLMHDGLGNIYVGGILFNLVGNNIPSDLFVAKYDPSGNLLWFKSYDYQNDDGFSAQDQIPVFAMDLTADGGLILASGSNTLFYESPVDGLLIRLDPDGNLLWAKEYPNNTFLGVLSENDGGFALLTNSLAFSGYLSLIKTDSIGDSVKTIPFENFWGMPAITGRLTRQGNGDYGLLTNNNFFIVAPNKRKQANKTAGFFINSGSFFTVDTLGNIGFSGLSNQDLGTMKVVENGQGSFLATGKYYEYATVLHQDSSGQLGCYPQFITYFPSNTRPPFSGNSILVTVDSIAVSSPYVGMASFSGLSSNQGCFNGITPTLPPGEIVVFPNPSMGDFIFQFSEETPFGAEIFDLQGKCLFSGLKSQNQQMIVPSEDLAPGIYIARIEVEGRDSRVLRLIKVR